MTDEADAIDLDAIEADLQMVEASLASLAAGTYFGVPSTFDAPAASAD